MGFTTDVGGPLHQNEGFLHDGTGLWSTILEDLTDDDTDNDSTRDFSPRDTKNIIPTGFSHPDKAKQKAIRDLHRKERVNRLRHVQWAWKYHQTRHWSMRRGRKCNTSFKGRPDLVTRTRPAIPEEATPEETLKILEAHGYKILSVEQASE
jgi:hypothetical protein